MTKNIGKFFVGTWICIISLTSCEKESTSVRDTSDPTKYGTILLHNISDDRYSVAIDGGNIFDQTIKGNGQKYVNLSIGKHTVYYLQLEGFFVNATDKEVDIEIKSQDTLVFKFPK